ncbi:protealysin inhibitor emfourin [Kribbella sp. NPDC048915]|uniref:protealysin inhibitor emfourin n=1 Tax=Kribbella sp. NPDC048915 TaxID=3155148 RepID=UPI0033E50C84
MIVKVRRSGGFAGLVQEGELDTTGQPDADRLEAAVHALGPKHLGSGQPQPDRYVYRLEVRDVRAPNPTQHTVALHTIAEQDLDETTAWLLDRVLTPPS